MQPSLDFSGAVAAKVRHDLRNPLSDILGFCDVLREEAVERQLDQLLPDFTLIHEAASRIFAEVNHALSPENLKVGTADFTALEATIRLHAEKILITTESSPKSAICSNPTPSAMISCASRAPRATARWHPRPPRPDPRATRRALRPRASCLPPGIRYHPPTARTTKTPTATLLVVDDNESNRALLARRLRRQRFTVVLAENGRQALDKLRLRKFDLVLLDVIMPEMDGYRVLAAMKSDDALRHIPVIMISALDDLEVLARCIEAGAEDYLSKPFDPVLLKARIESCLDKKRLHDQEQRTYQALVESQQHLAAELAEAARYVESLLPPPANNPSSRLAFPALHPAGRRYLRLSLARRRSLRVLPPRRLLARRRRRPPFHLRHECHPLRALPGVDPRQPDAVLGL
jgi:adenylate cyclase